MVGKPLAQPVWRLAQGPLPCVKASAAILQKLLVPPERSFHSEGGVSHADQQAILKCPI